MKDWDSNWDEESGCCQQIKIGNKHPNELIYQYTNN